MDPSDVKRSDFRNADGERFIFGCATSAYQVEGAWDADGKGRSNWDHFTLHTPDGITDGSNGCVALDQYNMFKDDVDLIKKVGFDSYRFSISWSRILPGGRLCGGVSKEGIKYYNNLIDALLAGGIEPWVTLFHWDVPQCLEAEYGGFLNNRIVNDFCDFAEVCFWEFGDRVKRWITLNEPWSFTIMGYMDCMFPPCRGKIPPHSSTGDKSANSKDQPVELLKVNHRMPSTRLLPFPEPKGDPGTEPYTVAHNLILAHACTAKIYREKYKEYQGGKIGMSNVSAWFYPFDENNTQDVEAASRAVDFMLGWFVAPVTKGEYPPSMRKIVGQRLPEFKENEVSAVKDSCDFLGINYYTTYYAKNGPMKTGSPSNYDNDLQVEYLFSRNGELIGPQAGSKWLYIVPDGIKHLVLHIKNTYNNPDIYITENGVNEKNDKNITISKARSDGTRIDYHKKHLAQLRDAKEQGAGVKGYFIWSLLDNFEWAEGYTVRSGIFYADFVNGRLTRFPKNSAIWWTKFMNKTKTPWNKLPQNPVISGKQQAEKTEEGEHGTVKKPRSVAAKN